jgi:ABC-type molybdate transport system substrate-binding protein
VALRRHVEDGLSRWLKTFARPVIRLAPIIYPATLMAESKNPATARLLEFPASPAARPLFEKGF